MTATQFEKIRYENIRAFKFEFPNNNNLLLIQLEKRLFFVDFNQIINVFLMFSILVSVSIFQSNILKYHLFEKKIIFGIGVIIFNLTLVNNIKERSSSFEFK